MGLTDSALRGEATPIRLLAWGQNRGFNSEANVANFSGGSDLSNLTGARGNVPAKYNPIRVVTPHYGKITKAYLDFKFQVQDNETGPLSMKLCRGTFQAGSVFPTTTYLDATVDDWQERLTGSTTAWTAAPGALIEFYRLDITDLIPDESDPDYREDGFVIVCAFDRIPKSDGLWSVKYFELQRFTVEAAGVIVP